ncbi:MAG: GNAT family N-acetyltransferase [Halanaeroarchaeum sp.]
MTVSLARATINDVEALADAWVRLVADQRRHGAHLRAVENRSAVRSVLEQYVHANGIVVARGPEALRGFVMFHVERGMYQQDVTRGVVENLFVEETHRDAGIGSRLLSTAESELADRGADVVSLSVLAANERGRSFYADRGYEPHRIAMERSLEE